MWKESPCDGIDCCSSALEKLDIVIIDSTTR